jgi:hypothetical protein
VAVTHFRELIAWQKAMDLVVRVYKATDDFPKQEMFGLVNQVRRAAVSVPRRLNYLSEDRSAAVLELADELGRIINGLISSLTTDN